MALSACGGGSAGTRTVTVATSGATSVATTAGVAPHRTARRRERRTASIPAARKACDANVQVKTGTTSCAFGENVFYAFWRAQDQGDDAFAAYSPVTKRSYAMRCNAGNLVVCRAGDGGEVRFPMAAVDSYNVDQAARYAATHDVGPETSTDTGTDDTGNAPQDDDGGAGSNCDPSYTGACLDPDAVDYDCDGGTGDGPEYTGTVDVVGDDHFDLDRDGDGVGCD